MKYPKIPGPFARYTEAGPMRGKLIEGQWSSPELELLGGMSAWNFTEKADGSNQRILWDGYRVTFAGRTDDAQTHPDLQAYLEETFVEELFEQKFGETPVVLYGEAIGPKIQSGGLYGPTRVVLFDVLIDGMWLLRPSVVDIAEALGVDYVPLVLEGASIYQAISFVRAGMQSVLAEKERPAEGLVGTLQAGLLNRRGQRIMVKIKAKDFK